MYLFIFLKHLHQYPLSILHILYIFIFHSSGKLSSLTGPIGGFIVFWRGLYPFLRSFFHVSRSKFGCLLPPLWLCVLPPIFARGVLLFRVWMHVCATNLLFFMKLYASILTRITIFLNRHINIPALSATVM